MPQKDIKEQVEFLNGGWNHLMEAVSCAPLVDPLKMKLYGAVARSMEIAVEVVRHEMKRMTEEKYIFRYCSVCEDMTPQASQGEEEHEKGKACELGICEICGSVNSFKRPSVIRSLFRPPTQGCGHTGFDPDGGGS